MTKVYTIRNFNLPTSTGQSLNSSPIAIEQEKSRHIFQSNQRTEIFREILSNTATEKAHVKYFLYGLIRVGITLILTLPFSLIPVHNVIETPAYWYEYMLQTIPYMIQLASFILFNCSFWMNNNYIKEGRHFLFMIFIGLIVMCISFPGTYIIWSKVLHFQHPIPFYGYIVCYIEISFNYIILWYRFPHEWRKDEAFRKRLKCFLIAITFNQLLMLPYSVIAKILLVFPKKYQWIICIFLPLVKEINAWIMNKLACKAASGDITAVNITASYNISARHALFLAFILGSITTSTSSILLLAEDFMINVYVALRVIWMKKRNPINEEKQIEMLQDLIISEIVEFVVPLSYLLCFSVAYFGPNANLLGNVGNSYWQYNAVEDVAHTIGNIFMFFMIDMCSLVVCSCLLWIFCRINLYRVYIVVQKEFGNIFLVILSHIFTTVSIKILANNYFYSVYLYMYIDI